MALGIFLVALAAAAIGLTIELQRRWSALQQRVRAAEARDASAQQEMAALRRATAQAEADQQFLARFVRELPHVAQELAAGDAGRQIPRLLLGAVQRMLEPRKALVAVRRRPVEGDPERSRRLVVAAAWPEGSAVIGSEIALGQGEIGYAADVQRVMDRRDFDSEPAAARRQIREHGLAGWQPDMVAPMSASGELVGVIAVEGLKRATTEVKDVLRLVAQVGAVSVHSQAKYTQMKATASVDGLTQVFNKRYLGTRLAEEIQRAMATASTVSVFIFDVDHFKHYNDRNGHVAGDRLLQALAQLVQQNTRRDTVFGRFGGEEFLMMFPGATKAQALAAAENVRQAIAAHDFAFGFDQPLGCLSVSGGVAECPTDARDSAGLLHAADEGLYAAKRGGRNRVVAFEPRYLGGEEAQEPARPEESNELAQRFALSSPVLSQASVAMLASGEEPAGGPAAPAREDVVVVEADEFSSDPDVIPESEDFD
jgi:diguanylate cyclase (GGDEF)-like protein